MKITYFILASALSLAAHAGKAPQFSAFAVDDTLFVTVLADSCNNMKGSLKVDALCAADRNTRNWAIDCEADLNVMSTRMGCQDTKPVARVLEISLRDNNVAGEAQRLTLKYGQEQIEVQIKDN